MENRCATDKSGRRCGPSLADSQLLETFVDRSNRRIQGQPVFCR